MGAAEFEENKVYFYAFMYRFVSIFEWYLICVVGLGGYVFIAVFQE
jgi:hypothetical protein